MWAATKLVAGREIAVKIRDRTFLISTVLFLLIAAASTVLPAIFANSGSTVAVVGSGDTASTLDRAGMEVVSATDVAAAERLIRDGDVDAAVVPDDGGGVRVLAMDRTPDSVVRALSSAPPVQLLDPDTVDPMLAFLVPVSFSMVFFFLSISFGVQIAQSVTEEKQTRIVEILVTAVPVRALLAGKVLGNGALAFGQVMLIALVAVVSMQAVGGDTALLGQLGPAIAWFIPFFVVGFVLLASLWAVTGALVSRQEDISGASGPIQLLIMVPFFLVIFFNSNPTAMTALSYVPFSAPTAMPLRLFFGDAATWEPVLALLILLAAAALCIALAARLYEGSLLRTNGKTSLRAAWQERETRVS
ncbi:ABC transporter permease [Micromonospora sp. WMMD1102]|uniref:ABC transporter permease n=1 Tax=Micromonospora sp. WMMD1102 TaxID=3016105 RepID=UPI0024155E08|nr:ABC transporter permease [Micromonospora sp. WMMD1102]MDG4787594.1 ABC transporter permease [Micromonospora sp. WMMD1102]